MVVRLVRPPKLAGVHGYRWTVRLGISVDVKCRLAPSLARQDFTLAPKQQRGRWTKLRGLPADIVDPTNLLLAKVVYLERAEKLAHNNHH